MCHFWATSMIQLNLLASAIMHPIFKVGIHQYTLYLNASTCILVLSDMKYWVLNKAITHYKIPWITFFLFFTGVVLCEQQSSAGFSQTRFTAVQIHTWKKNCHIYTYTTCKLCHSPSTSKVLGEYKYPILISVSVHPCFNLYCITSVPERLINMLK